MLSAGYARTQSELIPLQTVRYRSETTLKLLRLHRRLLYNELLQPKTVKTVAVQAKCGLNVHTTQVRRSIAVQCKSE